MGATAIAGPSFAQLQARRTYDEAVKLVWRPLDTSGGLKEIVRAGTLAANSHNTQPWRFTVTDNQISIGPDLSRRCPAVDPDDHHLFASLGCAVENMVQAAIALGFKADGKIRGPEQRSRHDRPRSSPPATNELADAITKRQCTRAEYDGWAFSAQDLDKIRARWNNGRRGMPARDGASSHGRHPRLCGSGQHGANARSGVHGGTDRLDSIQ